MRSTREPVATHGNGFGVIPPFSRLRDLPPLATGCNHGALSEEGLSVKLLAG
jgi:hypothetical protein